MEPEAEVARGAALTDEQLLEVAGNDAERGASENCEDGDAATKDASPRAQSLRGSGQAGVTVPQEPPGWLAERMKDPWHGDEAKELWEGKQKAEKEAAAYHEVF